MQMGADEKCPARPIRLRFIHSDALSGTATVACEDGTCSAALLDLRHSAIAWESGAGDDAALPYTVLSHAERHTPSSLVCTVLESGLSAV